ncbi:MAG TPA: UDP-N-acetylglucosamine 4,6-dehydratase (inverting) [Longimicrobium sp.]
MSEAAAPGAGSLDDRVVLVTGGTGSFGQKLVETLLQRHRPRKVVVFSRDEQKQYEMRRRFPEHAFEAVRFFLGDVRDRERLYRALDGVDVVVHAAALKQVEACEYNPLEAVRTNILGAANLIDAAIDRNVGRVIALSTDKAVNPVNLYGATKLTADKLFIGANNYSGAHGTRFGLVRYGNVVGSRGSVVPLFLDRRRTGTVPVTDPRMTRFWITLEQGVEFVLRALQRMQGGEIFIPKIPSMNIMDLARALAPDCGIEVVGARPGEKTHEVLVAEDDAPRTVEYDDHFVIHPAFHEWDEDAFRHSAGGRRCPEGFRYGSDTNAAWLSVEELRRVVGMEEEEPLAV